MNRSLINAVFVMLLSVFLNSTVFAVPGMINYQGKVTVTGIESFTGLANFKFAIVDDPDSPTVSYWSNDSTSAAGSEPTASIQIQVTNNLFNVILGNTPMSTITPEIFNNDSLYLRVWFDDGLNGVQWLEPDQRITSVGYSIKSGDAETVDLLDSGQFLRSDQDDEMNGSLDVSGNVTIGSSTASGKLVVNGDTDIPINLRRNDPGQLLNAKWEGSGYGAFGLFHNDDNDFTIGFRSSSNGMLRFENPQSGTANSYFEGNVGIGTSNPAGKLHIRTDNTDYGMLRLQRNSGNGEASIGYYGRADGSNNWTAGVGSWGNNDDFVIGGGGNEECLLIESGSGNVGIGTDNPEYTLHVWGYIRCGDMEANTYHCQSADLAERLAVHPDYELTDDEVRNEIQDQGLSNKQIEDLVNQKAISKLEPGTVIVISNQGAVPCSEEYDTRLAGIISTQPAMLMNEKGEGPPVALSGKVPCKVTGKIEAGDLLTTSSIQGHAMKSIPIDLGGIEVHRPGTIVGKALGAFDGDSGVIQVWVGGL